MSFNKNIIEARIKKVALALGELNEEVVYVGGGVVGLYIDDPAAEDVRPTKDIDIFLEITSYGNLTKLQDKLAKKKFFPADDEEIMCRFIYQDILVDIMSTKEVGWASADKWFEPGLKYLVNYQLDDVVINILHVSYFLATKFNAFIDRKEDARYSRHFEDIINVLDNRINIIEDLITAPNDVKNFLVDQFKELLTKKYEEAILGHLPFYSQSERFNLLKEKLLKIIEA